MDRLTKGRLSKERELELKLAMLQIKYESESIANQLEFQRQVRETNQKMNNMIGYMSIGGLILTIIFFVIVVFTLR